ncbi:MAG: SBBP repeat-containing protein [Flavobacteriales bacterium]
MKTRTLTILALFTIYSVKSQPVLQWAKNMGGYYHDSGLSITSDNSGNVYTTGSFADVADFDPGAGTYNLTSAGSYDVFVSKLDSSGNFVWAIQIGGNLEDYGYSMILDSMGNVYLTGYFSGTVDFNPGTGTYNLTSAGSYDIFISKLDASGNLIWAKKMGTTGDDGGTSIILDEYENVYTTGFFSGAVDFDPGIGSDTLTSAGGYDIFITKLGPSGNFIWAKHIGGVLDDYGNSIVSDSLKNIYATGSFNGTADFDPGVGTFNLVSAGGSDIFITKLDSSGNFAWAKQVGAAGDDVGTSIIVNQYNNAYITGHFTGTVDFDPGTGSYIVTSTGWSDIFICKLDSSGNFIWAKQMGGVNNDYSRHIVSDNSNNMYTTGSFDLTADFDPGVGTFNLVSAGGYDVFISKLDSSGNFIWATRLGSAYMDMGYSIALDENNNIYTTGNFAGTCDFDPGTGIYNLTATGANTIPDVFVHKMSPSIAAITEIESAGLFILYPNPCSGIFSITYEKNEKISIEITNLCGKKILHTSIMENKTSFDLTNEAAGIYFINIITESGITTTRKIIRE